MVIPVYNVAKYLGECLDSILAQTYRNFIVFAVDDGATDDCGKILDEYAAKDSRIKAIHQKNGGISAARNTALKALESDSSINYVAFVDSDDRVKPRYLEKLVSEATKTKADIVICGANWFDDSGVWASNDAAYPRSILSKEDYVAMVFSIGEGRGKIGNGGYVFKHIFRAETVRGIRFPNGRLIEDEYYCISSTIKANNIRCIPDKLCDYRQRAGSLIHTSDADEKLMKGRKLCIPVAESVSKTAGELAIAAYISACVTLFKKAGITTRFPQEYFAIAESAREKGWLTYREYQRFKRVYYHPALARLWFKLRKFIRD